MATDYQYIAEQVYQLYTGGEPSEDTTIDIREVELLVEQQAAFQMKQDWFVNKNLDRIADAVSGNMLCTFTGITLQNNQLGGYKYFQVPAKIISLPGDSGLARVAPANGLPFYIVSASTLSSYKYSKAMSGSSTGLACLRGSIVEVHIPVGSPVNLPNVVDVDLVTSFANDSRRIDDALAARILTGTLQILAARRRPDLNTTDGVDNSR